MKINRLTTEQIESIPKHVEKWKNIVISTERINRKQAEQIVNSIYEMLEYKPPQIIFFDSPFAAYHFVLGQTEQQLNSLFGRAMIKPDSWLDRWYENFENGIYSQIDLQSIRMQLRKLGLTQQFRRLREGIWTWGSMEHQFDTYVWNKYTELQRDQLHSYLGGNLHRNTRIIAMIANRVCKLDYFISNFELMFDRDNWDRFKSLLQMSNYIFLREKLCVICDRPTHLNLDSEGELHAEGQLAIRFTDGTGFYSQHGRILPTKYGKIHPNQWQTKFILKENNPSLRSALVTGIGYVKISAKLPVTEIDSWQNYLLIRIDIHHNSKLFYLLRIDINTGKIKYAMEIPNEHFTVEQAASSIHWEIFPPEPMYPGEVLEYEEKEIPF